MLTRTYLNNRVVRACIHESRSHYYSECYRSERRALNIASRVKALFHCILSLRLSSVVTNIFSLIGSLMLPRCGLPTITHFLFLLGASVRLVRGLALAYPLIRLYTGLFWAVFASPFPFSSAACTVPSLITTASFFRSHFLVGIGTRNGQGHSFAAYW